MTAYMTRVLPSMLFLCACLNAASPSPAATLWNELREKRDVLPQMHQEFDVSQEYKLQKGTQASKRTLLIDMSNSRWREKTVTGSGNRLRMFDGHDMFLMEEGGDEFVRVKRRDKAEIPAPAPYTISDADWSRTRELERRPCGFTSLDHPCVILDVPLKPQVAAGSSTSRRTEGDERVLIDLETGLLLSANRSEVREDAARSYVFTISYQMRKLTFGGAPDPEVAKLAAGVREVKELSAWNAAKLKKMLTGKPAPELNVQDIRGNPVSLADHKGKTVLLDFWTTWCPPCRADAPSLDKLYARYGERDLTILGVSVSEDRAVVEKFLGEHPHPFPTILTTENEMPRPYQIGVFPTYIVIEKDGTVGAAVEGGQGFSDLRRLLKKAGLEID